MTNYYTLSSVKSNYKKEYFVVTSVGSTGRVDRSKKKLSAELLVYLIVFSIIYLQLFTFNSLFKLFSHKF